MKIVMGSPGIILGRSHSGNVSAMGLAHLGLLDVLTSDYVPRSLLHAAFAEAAEGFDLPKEVAMVTKNPADLLGSKDRGHIAPGPRADLLRRWRAGHPQRVGRRAPNRRLPTGCRSIRPRRVPGLAQPTARSRTHLVAGDRHFAWRRTGTRQHRPRLRRRLSDAAARGTDSLARCHQPKDHCRTDPRSEGSGAAIIGISRTTTCVARSPTACLVLEGRSSP